MMQSLAVDFRVGKRTADARAYGQFTRSCAILAGAFCLLVAVVTPAAALSSGDRVLVMAAFELADRGRWDEAHAMVGRAADPLPAAVLRWHDLMRDGSPVTFRAVTDFRRRNPDFPGQLTLRRRAETALAERTEPADRVLAWFAANPPMSADGVLALLQAAAQAGRTGTVAATVRRFWIEKAIDGADQAELLRAGGHLLRTEDHWARLDRLVWENAEDAAARLFDLVDPGRRALAQARLRLRAMQPGVDAAIGRVPAGLRRDPGLLFERLLWRRRKDRTADTLEILNDPPEDLGQPRRWWRERHIIARRYLYDGQAAIAYRVAAAHRQTEGLPLYQAEFFSGWVALRFLKQPRQAFEHFQTLHRAVSTPISTARAAYWSGRALEVLGNAALAREWFGRAAVHGTTFYGQLAAERLGRTIAVALVADPTVSAPRRAHFERNDLVRIVRLLHEVARRDLAARFLYRLGILADDAADYLLVIELADAIGRPEIAVFAAKRAVRDGIVLNQGGYPLLAGARGAGVEPALIHGLIRQESTFDVDIVSPAGARGLMQLMPTTAQSVARGLGLSYQRGRLTSDAAYNIRLGTTYLRRMIDRFDGSYVLAVAAYNAGPGRSDSWMGRNGNPRRMDVDAVVDWIELIPIYETRNYVQRVLEATQVYRARLGEAVAGSTLTRDLTR